MKVSRTLYVTDRADWRDWLENNHAIESEVWLVYYKKHSGRARIPYDDAVEEALCFGWIDSIVKRIDDRKYVQRFTPRKRNSRWSDLNKKRVKKLIQEGRMTEAGLARISEEVLAEGPRSGTGAAKTDVEVPQYFKEALKVDKRAWENFNNLAPSYRRQYVQWVGDAKREETRRKRLEEARQLLSKNKKPGMK
ncbi:MAG TPA: YdeI/OmpD-associated family protein [Blastocatellia bacterium]|nr:YdeI/OmpD-associated family protein [Blastocatellia bacterium]